MKNSYTVIRPLLHNALSGPDDVHDWRMEGEAAVTFPRGRMRLESLRPAADGQDANIVFWCPQEFPENIEVTWRFRPLYEPGLCILFFAATGRAGEDIFAPHLAPRTGPYTQYHHGDIDTLHVSYFRRSGASVPLNLCNLRKSHGFHLVAQGADPIPSVSQATGPYTIRLIKLDAYVAFYINEIRIFEWLDDGKEFGSILGGGKIGFRQMSPLIAEYSDLTVNEIGRT